MSQLEGIADADALLGRPFPLPAAALPLARWVDVRASGHGAEVVWSLDDTRPAAPGRLALYAGPDLAPPHELEWEGAPEAVTLADGTPAELRVAALEEAQPSLRPVAELRWHHGGLHLRLTAQGPWDRAALLALAGSIAP
jgi:hypothetical protein